MVQAMAGAYKGLRLYPLQHPAIERLLEGLLNSLVPLFAEERPVRMGLLEGVLFLEDQLFSEGSPAAEELARLLQMLELEGLEFHPNIGIGELRSFLGILKDGGGKGETFQDTLTDRGIHNIRACLPQSTEEDEEDQAPRKVYGRALKVVDKIFQDMRLGKIPSSTEARRVVKSMVKLTLADPHALFALSMLRDYDNYTFNHSVNVSVIALAVGRACGLDEEQLRTLGLGGLLHDLGKLIIDRRIITKPGRLTDEEFAEIRKHPQSGAIIVRQMEGISQEVIDIVLCHHLRYDRKGYPEDARGRSISPLADMAAIADTYDAMTTLRSYQHPMTPRKATARLRELGGTVLHPRYVELMINALGPYPVGSLVRLDSNEIGLVIRVDTRQPDTIDLKVLFDGDGERLAEPVVRHLPGSQSKRIIAEVDPFSRGIEVGEFF
ncbi:cyclic diguanylate phosphodiesterase [Desulfuromonas versatilis]|uniref:Cyclic diguanylate phosphodiesterase n=2 Tax=Desulfuromonas versatilis TaxID=2802975 RepID=A0ABN6E520_9BACT|nr:cyclic diguanylate phosphodiesterase [Desulfuromonas versatilis]